MDLGKLFKWIVIIAIAIAGWKYLGPMIKEKLGSAKSSKAVSTDGGAASICVNRAAEASEAWGSGLARFVNPPYDLDAWGGFRGDVDAKIAVAQAQCGCDSEACSRVKTALDDLRSLVSDLDTAIRSGTAPEGNIVQRQESIDDAIDEARALATPPK